MARPQINIRVDEDRKERWKEAAEEAPEYDGLTHLIRLAVEKELTEDESPDTTTSPATVETASNDMLREVKGNTERIEDGITDVKARLSQIESRVGGQAEFSLRAAIRETLPVPESGPNAKPAEDGLTEKEIAARLNADRDDVTEALDALENEGEVRSLTGGSPQKTVYVRSGGV